MRRVLQGVVLSGLLAVLAAPMGCVSLLVQMGLDEERHAARLMRHEIHVDDHDIVLHERPALRRPTHTLVLLHGFAGDKDHWTRFARYLDDDARVLAFDLPGFGESSKDTAASYDLVTQVRRLHDILGKLDATHVVLVGNSMGGHLAALYALTYPNDVDALALFDPAGVVPPHENEMARAFKRGENPLLVDTEADFDRLEKLVFVHPPELPGLVKAEFAQRGVKARPFNNKVFEDMRHTPAPLEERLAKLQAPTLVVWGNEDQVIDVSAAEVWGRRLPHGQVVHLSETGHAPMIERPAECARLVEAFVQRTRTAPSAPTP
jgi:pimeloyl-ACP methyl ester carboxylesterase